MYRWPQNYTPFCFIFLMFLDELAKAFQLLETRLLAELNLLKEMIGVLMPTGYQQQFYTKSLNLQQYFFQQQQFQLQQLQQKQLQKQQLESQQLKSMQQSKESNQAKLQENQQSESEQTKKPEQNFHRSTQTIEVKRIPTDSIGEDDYDMDDDQENAAEEENQANKLAGNGSSTSEIKKKSLDLNRPKSILNSITLIPVTVSTTTEKAETTSEKILEFRPVLKKALNRPKIYERYIILNYICQLH